MNGRVDMINAASSKWPKVRDSSTKMMARRAGTTTFSFATARSRYSNCPVQLRISY